MLLRSHFLGNSNIPNDVHIDISFDNAVLLVTLSTFIFAVECIALFAYYNWRVFQYVVETRIGIAVFAFGALLTTITTLSAHQQEAVYAAYRLVLVVGVGIVVLVVGCAVLFENPAPQGGNQPYEGRTVGRTHGSMGVIIWVVTLPLIVFELLFAIGAATKAPNPTYASVEFVELVQKIAQASVYHFSLRHKVAPSDMKMGCSWLLKIISFFNFAFWIDSIVTSRADNKFVENVFGDGFSIIKSAYNALLIDYSLLCCLLFLEHSLELMEVHPNGPVAVIVNSEARTSSQGYRTDVNVAISQSSGCGYIVGLLLMAFQIVAGLQYLDFVGRWVNIFPIVSNCAVVLFGILLLHGNASVMETEGNWRETESKAVDTMVCFMGAIGSIFWFFKASFCGLWTYRYSNVFDNEMFHYLTWTTFKDFVYAVGIVFQLVFFVKMGPHFGCGQESSKRRMNHFLVTTVMMALLAMLISFVIDEYNGLVEDLLCQANIGNTMKMFFKAAAPIHLGFSLHMFLHFFIMNRRLQQFQYSWFQQVHSPLHHCQESLFGLNNSNDPGGDTEDKGEQKPLLSCDMPSA